MLSSSIWSSSALTLAMRDVTDACNSSVHMVWDCGEASLQSLGGMLGPVTFRLPDGRPVQPLHVAPWENEDLSDQPPILRRLRGEWPCVPFGMPPEAPLPERWQLEAGSASHAPDVAGAYPHGSGSNHHWCLASDGVSEMTAEIDYPPASAISHMHRRITATPGKAELTFELSISARRDCRLPIGLHPVFALSSEPGSMHLDPGNYAAVHTHPLEESPGITPFESDAIFADLSELPARDGSFIDACRLPFTSPSENLLLLSGASGKAALTNTAEGYVTELEWDRHVFPSLMLWISNRGRTHAPWSGRHLALGMEPVRAAFDLGEQISAANNPLRQAGIETSWDFTAGECLTTRYAIRCLPRP
ncbi:hypothetical protein RHIZ_13505 [Rhizobium skierniewicense]|uniref:hypothetical protein n=1 Tax=Rhizobium skierniewicense TaxID=984260 RepID=UPI001FAE563B|nr:hypothetical protein [Rhizobium skierniewicense]MCI9866962.1 hypothetical protein [Rhizobium skierniewicense]